MQVEMNAQGPDEQHTNDEQQADSPAPGIRLTIELDNALHISTPSGGARLKARLIGMLQQRALIIQVPAAEYGGEFRQFFPYGGEFLVRYLHDGVVFGFRSIVTGTILEPEKLVFLSWPAVVQQQSIRSSRRLETFIPCRLDLGQGWQEARVTDLSATGCQCVLLRKEDEALPDPKEAPAVAVEVAVSSNEGPVSIPGQVRRCHTDSTRMELGIAFDAPQEDLYSKLFMYLPSME